MQHTPRQDIPPSIELGHRWADRSVALNWNVRFDQAADGFRLVDADTLITLTGIEPAKCRLLLDRLDGQHSIQQLSQYSGITESDCTRLVSTLVENGLARPTESQLADSLTGRQFAGICRQLIPGWKRRLFDHSLWRSLSTGTAPRIVFQGWLLENFHFIEGVTLRLGAAAAHCSNASLRKHFIKHFSEEYDHCGFFRRALAACGVAEEDLLASQPLVATVAVLNWMRDAARQDPLCYATCSAFLESTGTDRHSANEFYRRLAEAYEPEAVEYMARHAALDEEYGHEGFLEKICSELQLIEPQRAERAIQYMWGLVETLELWSTVVERHYSNDTVLRFDPVRIYAVSRVTDS